MILQPRLMFLMAFGQPDDSLLRVAWGMNQPGIPRWQKVILGTLLPLLARFAGSIARVDMESVEEAKRDMHRAFDQVKTRKKSNVGHMLQRNYLADIDVLYIVKCRVLNEIEITCSIVHTYNMSNENGF